MNGIYANEWLIFCWKKTVEKWLKQVRMVGKVGRKKLKVFCCVISFVMFSSPNCNKHQTDRKCVDKI